MLKMIVWQIEEEPEEELEEPAEDDSEDKEDDSEDKDEIVDEEDDDESVRTLNMLWHLKDVKNFRYWSIVFSGCFFKTLFCSLTDKNRQRWTVKHWKEEHVTTTQLDMEVTLVPAPPWSDMYWVGSLGWGFLRRALFVFVFFLLHSSWL